MMKSINILIPFYNEQDSVKELIELIDDVISPLEYNFSFTLVDDGSNDETWSSIKKIEMKNKPIKKIKLSRNFGHQGAIFSGLESLNEDAVIIMDGDFQDNPIYIPELLKKWEEGNHLVLAKRTSRDEGYVRRMLIRIYFKLQNKFSEISIPENVGHFSLLDKKIVNVMNLFPESNKFLLGIRSYVGFKVAYVDVVKNKRLYGNPKMDIRKLLRLSSEGLIGFSTTPLSLIGVVGLIISIFSLGFSFYTLIMKVFFNIKVLNWDFGLTSIYFLSGVQLLAISILGQYIAKIFNETKHRPQYIIEEISE